MDLQVRVDCTERCFSLPEWKELLDRDPNRHIFTTPQWNKVWWDVFKQGKDLFLLTMKRDDDVVAIVPLYRKKEDDKQIWRFIGGIDLTDYLGPICSLEDRDDVASALTGWLAETDVEWHEFDAHNMLVPFGFAEFLVDHADRRGFDFTLDQEDTSAVLLLPDSWEEYMQRLEPKERHELRRKRRRLSKDYPDATTRTATEETLDRDLKLFFEMHRSAEGHKAFFMRPQISSFFERIAREFMPLGWLRLDFLEIAERAIAATFGFVHGHTFYLYNSAYEPDVGRLSPGLVLASELVNDAMEMHLEIFDFLRGPERYKYELGADAVPLNNVRVFNKRAT